MTSTALLIMDVQEGTVSGFASGFGSGSGPGAGSGAGPGFAGYLPRLGLALSAARGAGVGVIYVTVGFREGYPEVSSRNKIFGAIAGSGRFTPGDPGLGIHPSVAPAVGDVVVTKRRVSAFAGLILMWCCALGALIGSCWRGSLLAGWCFLRCGRRLTWTTG